MRQYEVMFLMDPQTCTDVASMAEEVRRILDRTGAEVDICRKWEDRRLAYEIKGRKRGSYWLTYFKAAPENLAALERDVQLSEKVLRVLALCCEQVPESEFTLQKQQEERAAAEAAKAEEPAAEPVDKPSEVADQPKDEAVESVAEAKQVDLPPQVQAEPSESAEPPDEVSEE